MKKTFEITRTDGTTVTVVAERADVVGDFMSFSTAEDGTVFMVRAEMVAMVDVGRT